MTLSPAERRAERYRLLEYVRGTTPRKGGQRCMFALGVAVGVGSTAAGVSHVQGVQRCGSPWACPVCAPVVRERRAAEIDQGLSNHLAAGGLAYFVTSTVSHSAGTPLQQVLSLVADSWSACSTARAARSSAYVGQIRALEITHGRNGWHPHVHALMLFAAGTKPEVATAYLNALSSRWSQQLAKRGASCGRTGFDIRPVHANDGIGSYVCKVEGGWGAGLEVARGDAKRSLAPAKGSQPWDFLTRAANGDTHAAMMWRYYEDATKGRNAIVWSRGLKAALGVADISNEEAAEAKVTGEIVVLAIVPRKHWRRILANGELAEMMACVASMALGQPYVWRWPPGWITTTL